MFNLVLVEPEIPPNTGNVIRLCANTGCALHLIEPLGFLWDDAQLRRAGLDYHEFVDVRRYASLDACRSSLTNADGRWFAMTTRGGVRLPDVAFRPGDVFVFGRESAGLSAEHLALFPPERRLRLPMRAGQRSLNLSNAVAVTVFEAWRQNGFRGSV